MKTDGLSAYVQMTSDAPLTLYATEHILDDPPSIPLVMYILNEWPISQPKSK